MNNTLGLYNFVRGFRGVYQNGEAYKPCILITVIQSASIQEQTNYGSNQNAFCIYWFLIKLQNVTMIKGIHFDNSLRMVFTRGEGLVIGCIFVVVCLQVNGPTTGRAYYAPFPPPLIVRPN